MAKVRICVDVPEAELAAYRVEAARQGVTVELLIERMIGELVREMKQGQTDGTDHPIIPA
jgi:hypothetical protein